MPSFTWLPEPLRLPALLLFLAASAVSAVLLFIYLRRLQVDAAQKRLSAAQVSLIALLESRVRVLEEIRDDCQRRLDRAEKHLEELADRFGRIWQG